MRVRFPSPAPVRFALLGALLRHRSWQRGEDDQPVIVARQAPESPGYLAALSGRIVMIGASFTGNADSNVGATDTLTIALNDGGATGKLTGTDLGGGSGGVYSLTGSATTISQDLEGLVFTPSAGTLYLAAKQRCGAHHHRRALHREYRSRANHLSSARCPAGTFPSRRVCSERCCGHDCGGAHRAGQRGARADVRLLAP